MTLAAPQLFPRSHRMVRLLPLLVLCLSLGITYALYENTRATVRKALQDEFNFRVSEIIANINNRMQGYEQVLHGTVGLFSASVSVERHEFRDYVTSLQLEHSYPGIQGVGYSLRIAPQEVDKHVVQVRKEGFAEYAIRPEGRRDTYTSIIYLEPFTGRNLRAFGFDMYSEPVRRMAMARARDTGNTAISSKVKLVQETDKEVQAGFLMYTPVYRNGAPHATLEERRANLLGWAYAPFRMSDLMHGVMGKGFGEVAAFIDLEIFDGDTTAPENLLYDANPTDGDRTSAFHSLQQIEIAGHHWTVSVRSLKAYDARMGNGKSHLVIVAGLAVSVLLTLIIWLLVTGRERALSLAEKMNRDLLDSEKRLLEAQRIAQIGNWNLDLVGGKLTWSDEIFRIFEIDPSTFGASYEAFLSAIHPEDRERVNRAYTDSVANHTPYEITHRLLMADGRIKWVNERCETYYTEDGKALRSAGTVQDITARKLAEDRLRELNETLELRVEAAVRKNLEQERLLIQQSRLAAMGEMAHNIAHQWRQPLNALALLQANIKDAYEYNDLTSASMGKFVADGQLLIQRMSQTIDNFRDFFKPSHEISEFPLQQAIDAALNIVSASFRAHDIALSVHVDGTVRVMGYPNEFSQALLNILSNAKDAILERKIENGEITLTSSEDDHFAWIIVTDNGGGMSEENLPKVFDPFFTTKAKGSGIGLYMARMIMEHMGGSIEAHNQGDGMLFKLVLPKATCPQA